MAGKAKKMKSIPMEHSNNNTLVGILCGISGGMLKYFIQLNEAPFMIKILEAGFTALLCGAAGAIGKHLVDKYYIHRKTKK